MTRTIAEKITAAAAGSPLDEAAAFLLTGRPLAHRLDQLSLLWEDDTTAVVDWPTSQATISYLTGSERRVLAVAHSLATGEPIDLHWALGGLGHDTARTVLVALSRAVGVHIHGGVR